MQTLISDNSNDFLSKYQVHLPNAIASLASSLDTTPLPSGFEPDEYDVQCGRGKGAYNKPGNKRFRAIVREYLNEYIDAKTKVDKSAVLNTILDRVKAQNNGQTRFVAFKDGAWYEISDDQSREKVGHAIREQLQAQEAAPGKALQQQLFELKHGDLLAEQRKIFEQLVSGMSKGKKTSQFKQARTKAARAA